WMVMTVSAPPDRRITAVSTDPPVPALEELVGTSAGRGLRRAASSIDLGSPLLVTLFEDVSPAVFISGAAPIFGGGGYQPSAPPLPVPNVCAGYADGSALRDRANDRRDANGTALPLAPDESTHLHDPVGWHPMAMLPPGSLRRSRRIDIAAAPNGGMLIDAAF